MERITEKMLQMRVDHLNKITGSAPVPWIRIEGKASSNIGNYHLSHAYGGVALHRMSNRGGGVSDIFGHHMPKRELYGRLNAYIDGYSANA